MRFPPGVAKGGITMSREIALRNIRLEPATRWGHTEYSLNYHWDLVREASGQGHDGPQALRALYDAWGLDFLWRTDHGLHGDWLGRGRATDMGHAVYASDGSDERRPRICPFRTAEEVWSFDPSVEYGLPDLEEQAAAYGELDRIAREDYPNQLTTGGYYRTIVSGAIEAFGWDMLLLAAADADRMERVFDGFFRFTLRHMEAWARTGVEAVIQHDDFVWTSGPFMNPEIYRKVLIPRYAELWKPLHAAGKKVLFCSDGDFTMFVPDLVEAGADGFIFEPLVDFGFMARELGATHCLIGSFVDCRDLTFGKWDQVECSLDRTFEQLSRCRGALLAVGNHLPANIPDAMMERYRDALVARLPR